MDEAHAALVQRFYRDVFQDGRSEEIPALIDPAQLDEVQDRLRGFWTAFSNRRVEIVGMASEADRAWTHVRITAVHSGEWAYRPATMREVTFDMVGTFDVVDGRLRRTLTLPDVASFMEQTRPTRTDYYRQKYVYAAYWVTAGAALAGGALALTS